MVCDGAVDREALVGTKRERHEEPRRERIVGEGQSNGKAGRGKWWIDRWEGVGALREGKKRDGRSTTCCDMVLGTLSFPQRASFCEGPSLHSHVGISRPQSAREVGRLHVANGPKVLRAFPFYNLSDSAIRRYFQHQACSLR